MKSRAGILLIHGFAGGLHEILPLRDALAALGYDVEAPVLHGHGSTRSALARSDHERWLHSADRAYKALARRCGCVIAVGFSMGGLVALNLNARTQLRAIVTVNTPIYYWHKRRIAHNLRHDFRRYAMHYARQSTHAPLRALLGFLRLLSVTKPLIDKVMCPLLVIQAEDDDTVHPRSVQYILERARGQKRVLSVKRGGHQLITDGDTAELARSIDSFIVSLVL